MVGTFLIIRRELASRRAVFIAAAFAGLLTLAAPLLPWVSADAAGDARLAIALVFAVAFTGGTAIAYGATMIATDLKERRLGFYFARPVSGSAIWAGKLGAGLLLSLGSGLLALLPAILLSRGRLVGWLEPDAGPFIVGGALLLLGLSHMVAIVVASRSRLVALDLVALVAVGGVTALILRRMLSSGAFGVFLWTLGSVAVATLLLILAAGWAQVAAGRCDPLRGHRAQSTVLWGGLGLTVALLGAFTAFLVGATPASLREADEVFTEGNGPWVAVQGPARWRGDYRASFLVDTTSGRFLRLRPWGWWWLPVRLSADGRRAVWPEADGPSRHSTAEVIAADLADPDSKPRPTRIFFDSRSLRAICLSPDGMRVALLEGRQVVVHDLADGRLAATALLENPGNYPLLAFVAPDRLRVELWHELRQRPTRGRGELTIGALDVTSGRFEVTARVELDLRYGFYRPLDSTAQRMALAHRAGDHTELELHDAWNAEPLATLSSWSGEGLQRVLFLDDGRIAVDGSEADAARLRLLDRDGRLVADYDLGTGRRVIPVSEIAPGRLLVTIRSTEGWAPPGADNRQGAVVDLDTGSVFRLGGNRTPVHRYPWVSARQPSQPGSVASRLVLNPNGGLELLDPDTGTTRHLLGPS